MKGRLIKQKTAFRFIRTVKEIKKKKNKAKG